MILSLAYRAQRRDAQPGKLEASQEGTSPVNTLMRNCYTQAEFAFAHLFIARPL